MIEKLREELIKDIVSYLDENLKVSEFYKVDIQNTITQIIVDSFDELEWSMNTNGNVELKNK